MFGGIVILWDDTIVVEISNFSITSLFRDRMVGATFTVTNVHGPNEILLDSSLGKNQRGIYVSAIEEDDQV